VPKKRRGYNYTELSLQANKQATLRKAEALTVTLAVLVTKVAQILADNCKSYIPLLTIIIVAVVATSNKEEGNFYTKGTVDTYITAVIEL